MSSYAAPAGTLYDIRCSSLQYSEQVRDLMGCPINVTSDGLELCRIHPRMWIHQTSVVSPCLCWPPAFLQPLHLVHTSIAANCISNSCHMASRSRQVTSVSVTLVWYLMPLPHLVTPLTACWSPCEVSVVWSQLLQSAAYAVLPPYILLKFILARSNGTEVSTYAIMLSSTLPWPLYIFPMMSFFIASRPVLISFLLPLGWHTCNFLVQHSTYWTVP